MTIHTLHQAITSVIGKGSLAEDHFIHTTFKTKHGLDGANILMAGNFFRTLHIDENVLLIVLEDNQTSIRLHVFAEGNTDNSVSGQLNTVRSRSDEVNVRLGDIYT